jgi:hypothetical protein
VILTVLIDPSKPKVPELLLPLLRVKFAADAAVGADKADIADTAIAPANISAEPFLIGCISY